MRRDEILNDVDADRRERADGVPQAVSGDAPTERVAAASPCAPSGRRGYASLDRMMPRTVFRRSVLFTSLRHYPKSRRGSEMAAVFNTRLETAKLAGVDPAKYLREAALADARGEVLVPGDLPR
jgi:hypothetical protein